ncbi:MAG: 16S rRNA (adenine(1518)-N(6)/adenine(1519)-N(6))-dimethyltransferase RsmA [Lysobacterales bacterium]
MSTGGHVARKRFGQNFLHDRNVIARILRSIAAAPGQRLVEIGPGQGALTYPLLDAIGDLTAIEIDRDLIALLRRDAPRHGRLHLIEADALDFDFTALAAGGRLRLVGNLPYNISSPILFHALTHAGVIEDMHFMLQKEVVERMAASHGNKDYGRLSVMLQARCQVEPLFLVPPGAFTPAPKVESAIVRLTPLPAEQIADRPFAALDRIVRAAFGQRRKTLRNALAGVLEAEQLSTLGIDPGLRAEQVSVIDFLRLASRGLRTED